MLIFFSLETNHFKNVRREIFTTGINKVVHKVTKILPSQPNITNQ